MSARIDASKGGFEVGKAMAESFLRAGVAGWGVLVGKEVMFEPGEAGLQTPGDALAGAGGSLAISTIKADGARQGTLYLVVPEMGAKCVVAPMLALTDGSDKQPEQVELQGEGMDAYNEAVNNLVGAAARELRQEIAGELKLVNEETRLVDMRSSTPAVELGGGEMLCLAGKASIAGLEPFPLWLLLEASMVGLEENAPPQAAEAAPADDAREDPTQKMLQRHAMKLRVPLRVVLARKNFRMDVIRSLSPGSIIEFRKQSSEHLDLLVGNVKIAEGEVIITRQHFGIQLKRLVDVRAALMAGDA